MSYLARRIGLYLVADGMGGHAAGEIASRTVAAAIEQFVSETAGYQPDHTWPLPYDPALSVDGNRMKIAFRLAHRRIGSAVVALFIEPATTRTALSDLPDSRHGASDR